MAMRFFKSDNPVPDQANIELYELDGRVCANVSWPPTSRGGQIEQEISPQTGLPADVIVPQTYPIARKRGLLVFVQDPDNLWQSDFGELQEFRDRRHEAD